VVPQRPAGETSKGGHGVDMRDAAYTGSWGGHLRAMDQALGQRDVDEARRAWESARLAAVESFSWKGLIAAGQACLRIGGATGGRTAAEPAARRAYFAALYRACQENSFEGILRAAEAFDDLGDREVVEECLCLAELQVDGEHARRRVAAFAGRLGVTRAPSKNDGAPAGAAGVA
jgi:hypothetical protein